METAGAPRARQGAPPAAALIREHADELAELECSEMGKPSARRADVDVEQCITLFEYYAGLVEVLPSQVREQGYALDVTLLEPYGVVAGIIPFNWPPLHIAGKGAPGLAVGNEVVLKPPEQAPLTILRIADLVQSVLPDDVLHIVPGGPEVGAALVAHPLVRKVAFTGSTEAGREVARTGRREPDSISPGTRRQESADRVRGRRPRPGDRRRDRRWVLQPR